MNGLGRITELEILADLCNIERKVAIFECLDDTFQSVADLKKRAYATYEIQYLQSQVDAYMRIFFRRDLVERGAIPSKSSSSFPELATAYRITSKGKEFQIAAGFMARFLPDHNISAYELLGEMHSPYEIRSTYTKLKMLLFLESGTKTLNEIADEVEIDRSSAQIKLEDLMNVRDSAGNKQPFVEALMDIHHGEHRAYAWSRKGLGFGQLGNYDDGRVRSLKDAMEALRRAGHVTIVAPGDLKEYRLTEIGSEYVKNCLRPILGYFEKNEIDVRRVLQGQLSESEFTKGVSIYILSRNVNR